MRRSSPSFCLKDGKDLRFPRAQVGGRRAQQQVQAVSVLRGALQRICTQCSQNTPPPPGHNPPEPAAQGTLSTAGALDPQSGWRWGRQELPHPRRDFEGACPHLKEKKHSDCLGRRLSRNHEILVFSDNFAGKIKNLRMVTWGPLDTFSLGNVRIAPAPRAEGMENSSSFCFSHRIY